MNNIEIVKTLMYSMGKTVEADKALAAACIVLLDEVMTGKKEAPAVSKPKKEAKTAAKRGLDHGKICALYKAGWSIKAIADEMGSADGTIRYHLQKEGLVK